MSMLREFSPKAVGHRLRLLRVAKGVNVQKTMATMLDASASQYSNWENGIQLIPVEAASKVCGLTGATLDYVYHGNSSALPMYLVSALKEAETSKA